MNTTPKKYPRPDQITSTGREDGQVAPTRLLVVEKREPERHRNKSWAGSGAKRPRKKQGSTTEQAESTEVAKPGTKQNHQKKKVLGNK